MVTVSFIEGNRSASRKYSGRVQADVFESRLGRARRRVASEPVAKITIDPEPFMTMLLEKLRKSDQCLGDCCLCLQHMFKDRPWLLRVSGETRSTARNSQAYRSNVSSFNCAHNSTDTEATQTLLTGSCSKPSLVKVCGKLV